MTARRPARSSITGIEARRPRRVAVLGAGGFIGSHLVPLLAARPGLSIIAVDRTFEKLPAQATAGAASPVERVCAAIESPGLLDDVTGRADVVISLTALCNPALYNTQPLAVIDANYTDLVPLVRLCAARRRWLIHFSTCEVYGRTALDGDGRRMARMDEDATAMFLGPIHRERWTYAAAKQLLERLIWAYGQHEGLTFTEVLQQLRRDLAVQYLDDPKLHISKIAWLLGFNEVSSFTHTFKRWTGKTPSQMRTAAASSDFVQGG